MILRSIYICLLRLHPRRFREDFGDEMLSTFEEAVTERPVLPLFGDAMMSLVRQWTLRPGRAEVAVSRVAGHSIDGVPIFYQEEQTLPEPVWLMSGGVVTILILLVTSAILANGGRRVNFYNPWARLRATPSRTAKVGGGQRDRTATSVDEEIEPTTGEGWSIATLGAEPAVSKLGRNYLEAIRLAGALDADGDGIISAAELENAPVVLQRLDTNHDGKLSPEEVGFRGLPRGIEWLTGGDAAAAEQRRRFLQRTRPAFMRFHPVVAALDADHDGVISAKEILLAAIALRGLDRNGDGRLTAEEYLPDPVENEVTLIMTRIDMDGDGKISLAERKTSFGKHYGELLTAADRNHDGIVTEQELRDEVWRRADLNRDGVVTWPEMLRAQRAGAFGQLAVQR